VGQGSTPMEGQSSKLIHKHRRPGPEPGLYMFNVSNEKCYCSCRYCAVDYLALTDKLVRINPPDYLNGDVFVIFLMFKAYIY
jgi:hypothetical protein